MKPIQKLWLRHRGESVTIFGNGVSLLALKEKLKTKETDNLPEDFFGSTWVGINYSPFVLAGEDFDYVITQSVETHSILKEKLGEDKLILPIEPGLYDWKKGKWVSKNIGNSYGYALQNVNKNEAPYLKGKDYGINKNSKFFTYSHTGQTAIHLCSYMGFNKIYLVGFDNIPFPGEKMHYSVEVDPSYGEFKLNYLNKHREGDEFLINKIENDLGIKIINIGNYLL